MSENEIPENDPFVDLLHGAGLYSTYSSDKELFERIGLQPFHNVPHGEEIHIGKIKFENGSHVSINVICFPAQFWKMIVYDSEHDKTYEIGTGSGNLSSYWDIIENIVSGSLSISIKENTDE